VLLAPFAGYERQAPLSLSVVDFEAFRTVEVSLAVEKAVACLTKRQRVQIERRSQAERELVQVQQRLDRLVDTVDTLADGSLPQEVTFGRVSVPRRAGRRCTPGRASAARHDRSGRRDERRHAERPDQREGAGHRQRPGAARRPTRVRCCGSPSPRRSTWTLSVQGARGSVPGVPGDR
jgi:hypothetical protein